MKKILLCLIMILTFAVGNVYAKEDSLVEIIGDSTANTFIESVVANEDGSYVVVGSYENIPYAAKYDKDDKVIWELGKNSSARAITSASVTDVEKVANGYVMIGFSNEVPYILIVDDNGKVVVSNTEITSGYFFDVEVMDNGNIVVAGSQDEQGLFVVYDKDLKLVSEKVYDAVTQFNGLTVTDKGNVLLVGSYQNYPVSLEATIDGKVVWSKNYRFDTELYSEEEENLGLISFTPNNSGFFDVVEVEDGYVMVGNAYSNDINRVVNPKGLDVKIPLIVKYDKTGKYLWTKTYSDYEGTFTDVEKTSDGYYITGNVAGYTELKQYGSETLDEGENLGSIASNLGGPILLKVNKNDEFEWQITREFTGRLSNIDVFNGDEFIAVGGAKYDSYLVNAVVNSTEHILKLGYTYDINVNKSDNGSTTAVNSNGDTSIAYYNDLAIITAKPNDGYKIDTVKVVDSEGKEVFVTLNDDGTYSYPIYDDTWVTVTYKEIPPIPENPKTGVSSYIALLVFILVCSGIVYYNTRRNDVFKGL